jgi:hypothetical protein
MAGGVRQAQVKKSLGDESFQELDRRLVIAFTLLGAALTVGTFAVVVAGA